MVSVVNLPRIRGRNIDGTLRERATLGKRGRAIGGGGFSLHHKHDSGEMTRRHISREKKNKRKKKKKRINLPAKLHIAGCTSKFDSRALTSARNLSSQLDPDGRMVRHLRGFFRRRETARQAGRWHDDIGAYGLGDVPARAAPLEAKIK